MYRLALENQSFILIVLIFKCPRSVEELIFNLEKSFLRMLNSFESNCLSQHLGLKSLILTL
jgi:hypothetical protein